MRLGSGLYGIVVRGDIIMPVFRTISKEEKEIDPEILPLVKELNKMGLVTTSSCSGHKEDKHRQNAQIAINTDGVSILVCHGILSIAWNRFNNKK